MSGSRIIISRTDAIGDVMLSIPMAKILKEFLPGSHIIFLGKTYTEPVINCCSAIDQFANYDEFEKEDEKGREDFFKKLKADIIIHVYPRASIAKAAKAAGIPIRIGTRNRMYHWTTCNKLVKLSRKKSGLHESILNLVLLKPLGLNKQYTMQDLADYYSFDRIPALAESSKSFISKNKINLILHPKSHGSAREWQLDHYEKLIHSLPADRFNILITGGPKEKDILEFALRDLPSHVQNVAGLFTLPQLIAFINECDGIVAASTGPLHIGAALGKFALGIYPPIEPMDPSRWAPLGKHAFSLVVDKKCDDCRFVPEDCHCINEILPSEVEQAIHRFFH